MHMEKPYVCGVTYVDEVVFIATDGSYSTEMFARCSTNASSSDWPRYRIWREGNELRMERVDENGNPIAQPSTE
jgi:hypothetical protein